MVRGRLVVPIVLFAIFSAASIIGIYYTHQLPTEEERTTILCSYDQTGRYDYTAKLKPNNLYNQTTLRPGEGTLYVGIIEYINITFSYTFKCDRPANGTIEYTIHTSLETPAWNKSLSETPRNTLNLSGTTIEFSTTYFVNITSYEELVRTIEKETGTRASTFSLIINPDVHTVASTDVGTINKYLTPKLTITYQYGTSEGNYISIEGLEHTSPDAIKRTEKIHLPWVTNQRYASYAISLPALTGLAYTIWAFLKATIKPEKPLKEIIKPYQEIIAEAKEPSYEGRKATIPMKTLEDLAKVADSLAKPVLHSQKDLTHTYYVLDDQTKYEYTVIAKISEKKAKPKPPSPSS